MRLCLPRMAAASLPRPYGEGLHGPPDSPGGTMDRRSFLGSAVMAQAAQVALPPANEKVASGAGEVSYTVKTIVERKRPGKPHKGKMLAAIQPHCDDIPIFAAGTVLKLIDEGYTGYLITMSDDSMAGDGKSY